MWLNTKKRVFKRSLKENDPGTMRIWLEVPVRTAPLFEFRAKSCGINGKDKMGRHANEDRGSLGYVNVSRFSAISTWIDCKSEHQSTWCRFASEVLYFQLWHTCRKWPQHGRMGAPGRMYWVGDWACRHIHPWEDRTRTNVRPSWSIPNREAGNWHRTFFRERNVSGKTFWRRDSPNMFQKCVARNCPASQTRMALPTNFHVSNDNARCAIMNFWNNDWNFSSWISSRVVNASANLFPSRKLCGRQYRMGSANHRNAHEKTGHTGHKSLAARDSHPRGRWSTYRRLFLSKNF